MENKEKSKRGEIGRGKGKREKLGERERRKR
jgi:hypothetical protein